MDTEEFIKRANQVHNFAYDYSKSIYINSKTKLIIRCPKHNLEFEQIPNNHLNKMARCPQCARESSKLKQSMPNFIERAKDIHGNLYNYSKTIYTNKYSKVTITCNIHGDFSQEANSHLKGSGCPKCGAKSIGDSKRLTTTQFIEQSQQLYGSDLFNYSKVDYINNKKDIILRCKLHDFEFKQTPSNHLKSTYGCPKCVDYKNRQLDYSTAQFIEKANKVHNNLYDYSKFEYLGTEIKSTIICRKHGEFLQVPNAHVNKSQGCPNCCTSKGELRVKERLELLNITFIQQKTFTDLIYKSHLKFDFYLPDHNMVIEFHGRQHFEEVDYFGGAKGLEDTKLRDLIKKRYCEGNSIKYIELTDDSDIESLTL